MWLMWIGLVVLTMKAAAIGPVADWSWWWAAAPLLGAIAWFEGLERLFGRDRRRLDHDELQRLRQARAKKSFEQPGGPAGRGRKAG